MFETKFIDQILTKKVEKIYVRSSNKPHTILTDLIVAFILFAIFFLFPQDAICPLMSMMETSIVQLTKEDIKSLHMQLFTFFLTALDFRVKHEKVRNFSGSRC